MLKKLLLTAAVILVAYWVIQLRNRRAQQPQPVVIEQRPEKPRRRWITGLAIASVVLMLVGSALILWQSLEP